MIFMGNRSPQAQVHMAFRMPPERIMMPRHGPLCVHRHEAVFNGVNAVHVTSALLDALPAEVRNGITAASRERLYSGIFDRITDIRDPSQLNAVVRDLDVVVEHTMQELRRMPTVYPNPLAAAVRTLRRGTAQLVPVRRQERPRTPLELEIDQHLVKITEMVASIEQAIDAIEQAVMILQQRLR